jgi:MOSC domain-containing protein YiiM/ferredoxin-NADP reductase/ferredoxin
MNHVVSVNVGLPRDILWQGRTVRTSIFKEAVRGRVLARPLNLVGDGQADLAGHGGEQRALLVYQLDSYSFWQTYLNRSDFVYGQFGENLTVDGLADAEVCIGDRFRVGGAIFEVTQPRVTCYKVGLRLNDPRMPALMVSHRRPGFYFRVIEEGEIGAGDSIEKISDGPGYLTVASVDALLYTANHPPEQLRQALRVQALSPGWKASFEALLQAANQGTTTGNAGLRPVTTPVAWNEFRSLTVMASTQESEDVRSYELGAPDGAKLPDFIPGQYVALRVRMSSQHAVAIRSYSLCGALGAGRFKIAVKNTGGLVSRFLNEGLRVGDLVEVSAPRGSFVLSADVGPIVFLSAGIGVTPLLAMLHALVNVESSAVQEIWWIHSARDQAHHAFAGQARSMLGALKHVHICVIYSRAGAQDRLGTDYNQAGHLSFALLRELSVPRQALFYICGPSGYLRDTQAILTQLHVDERSIHIEIFGGAPSIVPGVAGAARRSPHLPEGAPGSGPVVTFVRSALALNWNSRFRSLLELAEACSVPVRWSCRAGVCHQCESGLIGGQVQYAPEPIDPPAPGGTLICCATPRSDIQLDL